MSWDQYSQTPASNDIANYFQTGMLPSKVKNAGWDIMADLAQFMSLPTSGGTANAQTVTNTRQFGALFTGMRQRFIPGFTNTGAATLAIDGLTAKNLFANGVAAIAGMIQLNVPCDVVYDGTQWNILNPQRSTGSFTITLTGMTATITGTINYAILPDGKTVYIWCTSGSGITGTSNAATMTGTGVPAVLSSATNHTLNLAVTDSTGGLQFGNMIGTNGTTWTFGKAFGSSAGFTTSGTKGLNANATWGPYSYTLD